MTIEFLANASISPLSAFVRSLFHIEAMTFHPAGAEAVRIRFKVEDGRATAVTVADGDLIVTARRVSSSG